MPPLILLLYALGGTLVSIPLACVPALHIYNVVGLLVLYTTHSQHSVRPECLAMFSLGMVVGYAILNTIPSIFVSAPDESTVWIVLPAQTYLTRGRGFEAALLTGLGSLGGLLALICLAPIASRALVPLYNVLKPHLHWLLGLMALYLVLSEWPKDTGRGKSRLIRLWRGLRAPVAGLLTFTLAGLLGLILWYRPITPLSISFVQLTPAFVGMFAVPFVLTRILSREQMPQQYICDSIDLMPKALASGVIAGVFGGLLAALFPVITAGIGGLFAGHATAQRDDRAFIISQGASKAVYYCGGILISFLPGFGITRGGLSWMLQPFYDPRTWSEYWIAVTAVSLCGALSITALVVLSRWVARLVERISYRWVSIGTLIILLLLVVGLSGFGGLLICVAAAGIGLIPTVFHCRRSQCMGLLLLPILLNMADLGSVVAGWLDLI